MLVRTLSGLSGLINRTAGQMLPQPGRLNAGSPPFLPPRSLHAWATQTASPTVPALFTART